MSADSKGVEMSTKRNEKRAVRKYAYSHVEKYERLISEIKAFRFKNRLSIAWQIIRGRR